MVSLIIAEKPQASLRIASALADKKLVQKKIGKVSYYELTHKNQKIIVACAVGHLYGLVEKNKGKWSYPIFDIEWQPMYKKSKQAFFSKAYLDVLNKLGKGISTYYNGCDLDVEGELIFKNILNYSYNKKDARRMRFSTLTKDELIKSFENASPHIDFQLAEAGETRHILDWQWGINLSRALTLSIKAVGSFKLLSSGRVQGPALDTLAEREKEISSFKSKPYWQIELNGKIKKLITAWHKKDKFWKKEEADEVLKNTKGKKAFISKVSKIEFNQSPPVPFDLTTLQLEAYRTLRIPPKQTLSLAQDLYTAGLISYPRTSSQKLPASINYKKIMGKLEKQNSYYSLIKQLPSSLKPFEGKKSDPAHPAIYPTGEFSKLDGRKGSLYDLIVRRFLAVFGPFAKRETITIEIDVNKEIFIAKGTRTIEEGWHKFYSKYLKLKEEELPDVKKDEEVKVIKINLHEKETQPPKRYTPASIIKELEKRNLGTKATRASIVDALYNRDYLKNVPIEVTDLGLRVIKTLNDYCPEIIDEELTRHFEEDMEKILDKKKKQKDVLEEAKKILTKILKQFKKNETKIGTNLLKAFRVTSKKANLIASCPKCKKGNLVIKKGRFGKFIACSNYPKCKITFSLPSKGLVKPSKNICKECNYPKILIYSGKRPQEVCLNPECPSKKIKKIKIKKKCPKCKGELVVKKSIYGSFLACSNYPKCKHTEKIKF